MILLMDHMSKSWLHCALFCMLYLPAEAGQASPVWQYRETVRRLCHIAMADMDPQQQAGGEQMTSESATN